MTTIFKEKGRLAFKGEVASGKNAKGYDWQRQDILIEIPNGEYEPKHLLLQAMNERVDELSKIILGAEVEVSFTINAREWNNRWFNNVMLSGIQLLEKEERKKVMELPKGDLESREDDLPFA